MLPEQNSRYHGFYSSWELSLLLLSLSSVSLIRSFLNRKMMHSCAAWGKTSIICIDLTKSLQSSFTQQYSTRFLGKSIFLFIMWCPGLPSGPQIFDCQWSHSKRIFIQRFPLQLSIDEWHNNFQIVTNSSKFLGMGRHLSKPGH